MDSPSDVQLARLVIRTLAAFTALTLAGGLASLAGRFADAPSDETASDTIVDGAGIDPRGGAGPLPGADVSAYVATSTGRLSEAKGRRAAIVSFDEYRTPEEADALLGDVDVRSLLVALPGGRPVVLAPHDDLAEVTKTQRDEATAEKKALEQLLPTVEDPDFTRQYQADIDRLGRLLAARADRDDVVFGAVVVASASDLRAMAATAGVRLVDVGSTAEPPKPTTFAGLRPEEALEAGEPPTRPA
ncbi:MAG TPA: hypothetical protein VM143_10785 [Acidimicrobiales bacterium]|nr:hypothetical protein [Acidimicrobiales bacterium]